jgi:hypothetical protein
VRVGEKQVGQAVAEVSVGAEDPQHVASVVGAFMQRQPMIGHYVSAYTSDITLEGMVLTLLHASVLARSVELAAGRKLRVVQANDLDAASSAPGSGKKELQAEEPELFGYLEGNVSADDPTLGGKRRATALSILRVVARALIDKTF